ncbi:ROK family protein [Carboxylicivirga sp. N1Y90]|uniref:ROK family protein n=1 Tax=Carboxylicivirga fragile TaxID=3417571 RepID=UPI003D33D3F5|nr:ROK family protein [Marinilabiliaceae bacterium N1Y90]
MIQDMTLQNQCAIGVYLGGKLLRVGRVKNNVVEAAIEREINNHDSEENILKEVLDAIDQVFNSEVGGIGIGVPSLVDVSKGIVYNVEHIPAWREVHLGDLLQDRYKVNVFVNNDANCFTIGEKYFGKAKKYSNLVGVIVGVGLGCGVITENRLYSGTNCGAGEFGCIPYRDHNYEYYCTTDYFDVKYGLKPEVLFTRAQKNDKIALAILEQFGFDFGQAIKTILYTYDPECIVIGGSIGKFFPFFEEAMWKVVRKFQYEKTVEKLCIEVSEEPDIAVLGAAALYYDAINK